MALGILSNELISLLTWTEKIYTCLLIKIREKIMNKGKERKKCYVDLQDNTVMILSQDLVLVIK